MSKQIIHTTILGKEKQRLTASPAASCDLKVDIFPMNPKPFAVSPMIRGECSHHRQDVYPSLQGASAELTLCVHCGGIKDPIERNKD